MPALVRPYREREALGDLGDVFAVMTDMAETCGRLTHGIARSLGASKCVVALYDPATREMVGQAPGYGVADEVIRAFRCRVDLPWLRSQGPMVKNRPSEFHPVQWEYLRPFEIYNMAGVPLVVDGRIIGMVAAGNRPGGFSHRAVRSLATFAARAAIALQNARLYAHLAELAGALRVKMQNRTAELEATNRELAISHARLREVDRLKSDFLGNVSHELRTPLASIKGFVDNLLDGVTGPLTSKQQHYLARMRDNADRLTRMVSDLLDLTRIEAGRLEVTLARVDLVAVLNDAVESLVPLARGRGIQMAVMSASCPPVRGDA
ncbi:MAG TPA: histidine kinase dimerization/phospho-acceptor domain-containing protein, partial [Methylomirabilota bacterium]|nr:histidine kinase dimerization/phospho-acceptor domain-containing protein [Methylomirabilota bacterium]